MNAVDDRSNREVRELLQAGRTAMPAEVDRRLGPRVLGAADPVVDERRDGRRARWLAAAVLVAGLAVVVAVQLAQQGGATPVQEPGPRDPSPGEDAQEPAPPVVRILDAEQTLQRAPLLVVVDIDAGALPGEHAADVVRGTVLRVLQGSGLRAGDSIELHRGSGEGTSRTFLDAIDLLQPGEGFEGPWLVALEPGGAGPNGAPRFRPSCAAGLPGTPVLREAPRGPEGATVADRLRLELVAGLAAQDPRVRTAATGTLCGWDGYLSLPGHAPLASSPWRDPEAARQLLARATAGVPGTRLQLAMGIPASAGEAGRDALERLCFDRYALIRISAAQRLARLAPQDWLAPLRSQDTWWCQFTFPPTFRSWDRRARQSALQDGIDSRTGSFLRQLDKARSDNHLLGAVGLGTTGDVSALPRLVELCEDEDLRVRAAAARSRVQLGDAHGHAVLRALVNGDDERGSTWALDMLATLDTVEAMDILATACKDRRPLVRALAVAALRGFRRQAEHMVAALRDDLRQDEAEIVRRAAR